ncbi:MAG: hypothetical protein QGF09_08420 [Rhodospirillales bacterium]|jgi:4-carboxymuconolactone decarboxylase|nr:hypothetical protein [Rhodospirillales bacterium]
MGIVAPVTLDKATKEQKELGAAIFARLGEKPTGPSSIYLHNPGFAQLFDQVRIHIGEDFSISTKHAELCMLVVIRFWSAQYAWTVHGPAGIKAGLSVELVEAIRTNQRPPFAGDDEETVYDYVSALLARQEIPDQLAQKALALLGEVGLVELVSICGVYTLVGQTCAAFDIALPEGMKPALG